MSKTNAIVSIVIVVAVVAGFYLLPAQADKLINVIAVLAGYIAGVKKDVIVSRFKK